MSVDLSQFIPTFLEESFEGLAVMESSLLTLEQGDSETINSIFRAAHSIKGGAGTFGFMHVTEFTHLVETLLDEMRDGLRSIEQSDVELLLESVDCMKLMIEAIQNEEDFDMSLTVDTTAKLEALLSVGASEAPSKEDATEQKIDEKGNRVNRWNISFVPEHQIVKTGNDPLFLFNALAALGDLTLEAKTSELGSLTEIDVEELYISWQLILHTEASREEIVEIFEWVEDECELIVELQTDVEAGSAVEASSFDTADQKAATDNNTAKETLENPLVDNVDKPLSHSVSSKEKAKTVVKAKSKTETGSIRVGVDKVDSLINLVGELVITQSMLSELGNDFDLSRVERLTAGLEQLLQNTKELQESVMRIRMLPISFAFNRFPRLIHDLSLKTGKQIELQIKGENTELDKTVMEQIGDPLVHLVRNAVDHGIESAELRLANGKPEQGTICLDAYHQGGNIVIEIADDGGGINTETVFNKAVEKGLIEASTNLTDNQIYDLLFEPGFSTAKEVSDISGRGVGMDVVKKNIHALGGRIQVQSTPGKGSNFKVNLPLTLAILDGQLIRVGEEIYIVPLITIVESLQAKSELINRVNGDMILYRLRDENVPVIPIFELFNIPADNQDINNSLLVVVEADGQKVGLMVDDLLAQQQVVIKSLKDNYQDVSGVSGATILGDGSVAMILDIPGLIEMALKLASAKQERSQHAANKSKQEVLV